MRYKLARTAAVGGILVLGLGSAQAAVAQPASGPNVPCFTPALYYALANASDGEVLVLAPGCTYWLNRALPDIETDLTIIGDGATLRRTGNAPSFTILSVTSDVNVSISSLSFVNGGGLQAYDGGALYNDGGNVSINGGVFRDNVGGEYAGAIENDSGTLTVTGATFADNVNYYEYGGAITNFDDATITGSTFTGNRSEYGSNDGYGGAIENEGTLWVSTSNFTGNSTNGYGGAIYNEDQATLLNDNLSGNSAYDGGAIYDDDTLTVTTSSITGNTASDDGGGIYNDDETVHLSGDYIRGNRPDNCVPFIFGCRN